MMKPPELSVIVPAHNEETLIGSCLDTVLRELVTNAGVERPELIVVASACSDDTKAVAKSVLDAALDVPSKVLSVRRRGKKTALNAGLEAAEGDMVLCIDGDVTVMPGAIARAINDIHATGTRLVGGQIAPAVLEPWVNRKPAPSLDLLGFARRQATRPHKTVRGAFMGFFRKDLVNGYGLGPAPDDTWLSAHMGTRFGLDAIRVNDRTAIAYVPPLTLTDLQNQTNRHRMGRLLVCKESPELAGYFEDLARHWGAVDEDKLDKRWRQQAVKLGLDFERWLPRYQEVVRRADRFSASSVRLPRRDIWVPQLSTKTLASLRRSRPAQQLTLAN